MLISIHKPWRIALMALLLSGVVACGGGGGGGDINDDIGNDDGGGADNGGGGSGSGGVVVGCNNGEPDCIDQADFLPATLPATLNFDCYTYENGVLLFSEEACYREETTQEGNIYTTTTFNAGTDEIDDQHRIEITASKVITTTEWEDGLEISERIEQDRYIPLDDVFYFEEWAIATFEGHWGEATIECVLKDRYASYTPMGDLPEANYPTYNDAFGMECLVREKIWADNSRTELLRDAYHLTYSVTAKGVGEIEFRDYDCIDVNGQQDDRITDCPGESDLYIEVLGPKL